MPSKTLTAAFLISLLSPLVAGHAAIVRATGDAGGQGMALGIDTATPRDGTRRNPFQQDATRFKGQAADTVGETLAGGDNDVEAGTTAIMGETGESLPQVTPGGEVQMVLHQVNGDGGGPYSCAINDDATAQVCYLLPPPTSLRTVLRERTTDWSLLFRHGKMPPSPTCLRERTLAAVIPRLRSRP